MNYLHKKPKIAVTGSAGKTTVKTLISAILREKWIIFESNDYNNTTEKTYEHAELISSIHRAVVLEYGMAYPGVITKHCSIIQPNISVITNIGLAHVGNFEGKIENLAHSKSELIKGMEQTGLLFINADDENSKLLETQEFTGTIKTIGIDKPADYIAKNVKFTIDGMKFDVILNGIEYPITLPLFGIHNVHNALFAIGISDMLGFKPEDIQNGLNNVTKPEHRLNVYKLKDNVIVIDDTVHAHPTAMMSAIDVLTALEGSKKIAILGSMPELGDEIEKYHKEIGNYVNNKGIDYLFTYGNISRNIITGAIENGFDEAKTKHYTPLYRRVLYREIVEIIEPNTIILVKGASRLDMFEIVKYLCEYYKVD